MKKLLIWLSFLTLSVVSFGQTNTLSIRSGDFNLQEVQDYWEADLSIFLLERDGRKGLYVIAKALENNVLLESTKVRIEQYVGNNFYYVWVDNTVTKEDIEQANLEAIYLLQPEWKIAPELNAIQSNQKDSLIEVKAFTLLALDHSAMHSGLASKGLTVLNKDNLSNCLTLKLRAKDLNHLADLPWFYWIELIPPPLELHNLVERTNHRVPPLEGKESLYKLDGKDVVVGEWDGSGAQLHIDYDYRHIQVEPFTYNSNGAHATHVAGTVLGAGIINPLARGMAPEAELVSYDFRGNIPLEMDSAAIKFDIELTQNSYSYGRSYDNCNRRGTYDGTSVALDQLTTKYDYLLHVFAAGNSRGSKCLSGGYGTVHSGFQASKNSIAVGALTNTDGNSSFHSYGPVKDGRLKPEICGVGVKVYSTYPYNTYRGGYSGTSMACPGVSGVAALVHQLYQDSNSTQIPAHLLKGSLCNGADEIGRSGPDFQYGFGRVNGLRTARIIAQNQFVLDSLNQNGVYTDTIYVPKGLVDFKVLLCWNDPAASPSANTMLVNDLDLTVEDSLGNTFLPWVLDATQYTSNATRGRDSINPIEQVTMSPNSPYYIIKVKGKRITSGYQHFSVNWLAQDTAINVIYPNGGEHWLAPSSNTNGQTIRWDNYGLSGTTKVEFSSDTGSTWTTLASSVAANRKYYIWTNAQDTLNTAGALIRVTKQGFTDSSDHTFHIGSKGPTPTAKICSEQLHLKWSAISNAAYYKVYRLDSGQMRFDSSYVPYYTMKGLQNGKDYWVAIGVVTQDGVEGPRSNGVKFTPNGSIAPARFTQHPRDTQQCEGSALELKVTTTGDLPISLRWQESMDDALSWTDLSNTTNTYLNPSLNVETNQFKYRVKAFNQCEDTVFSNQATIKVDTALNYTMSYDTVALCLAQDSIINVNYSAPNLPEFSWLFKQSIGSTPKQLTNIKPYLSLSKVTEADQGYYGVSLTNSCGTAGPRPYTYLDVRSPLSINNAGIDTICVGAESMLSIDATGGNTNAYDFWWHSDGDTILGKDNFYYPVANRTWTAGVFDYCSEDTVTKNIHIVMRDSLTLFLGQDTTLCNGQPFTLNAVINGGNKAGYTYYWDDVVQNSASRSVDLTSSAVYKLKVTDGCSADTVADEIKITVRDALTLNLQSSVDTACHLQEIQLHTNPEGGLERNYKIRWNDGDTSTSRDLKLDSTSYYMVTIEDGCSPTQDADSILIHVRPPLAIKLASKDTVCYGETNVYKALASGGNAASYQYKWNKVIGTDTLSKAYQQSELLTLVLEDNCTPQSAATSKFIETRAQLSSTPLASEITICKGQELLIGFSPQGGRNFSYAFVWDHSTNTASELTVKPLDTTLYTYTVSDGCTSPSHTNSITVNVLPALHLDLGDDLQKCAEDQISINLNGRGGLNSQHRYLVNNKAFLDNTLVFDDSETETIIIELLDDCTVQYAKDTLTVSVVPLDKNNFNLTALDHKTVELFSDITTNQVKLDWGDGNSSFENEERIAHTYLNYGVYTVCKTEIDNIGCEKTSCDTLNLYNPFTLTNFNVSLYPNPVGNEDLIIKTDRIFGFYTVRLMDSKGKTVYYDEGENTSQTQFKINMQGISSGFYVLEALLNNRPYRFTVIKE